jgi:hypothetical protein
LSCDTPTVEGRGEVRIVAESFEADANICEVARRQWRGAWAADGVAAQVCVASRGLGKLGLITYRAVKLSLPH